MTRVIDILNYDKDSQECQIIVGGRITIWVDYMDIENLYNRALEFRYPDDNANALSDEKTERYKRAYSGKPWRVNKLDETDLHDWSVSAQNKTIRDLHSKIQKLEHFINGTEEKWEIPPGHVVTVVGTEDNHDIVVTDKPEDGQLCYNDETGELYIHREDGNIKSKEELRKEWFR